MMGCALVYSFYLAGVDLYLILDSGYFALVSLGKFADMVSAGYIFIGT